MMDLPFPNLTPREVEALYELVGNTWFQDHNNSPRNHYKAIEYAMRGWCAPFSTLLPQTHPRQKLVSDMWRWMRMNYPRDFENLNSVPKYQWVERYRGRLEAVWQCFFFYAQLIPDWKPFTQHFKRRPELCGKRFDYVVLDDLTPMPPGTYTAQITDVTMAPDGSVEVMIKTTDTAQFDWDSGWEDCNEHDQEVIAMFNNVKTVRCQFQGDSGTNRLYDYMTDDTSIEVGDLVVVEANGSTNLVKVKEIVDGVTKAATKWVINKVDFTGYKARLQKIERARALKQTLDEALERKRKMIDYEQLVGDDENLKKLLQELKELQG